MSHELFVVKRLHGRVAATRRDKTSFPRKEGGIPGMEGAMRGGLKSMYAKSMILLGPNQT